jgi:CelD/BcsL family acetyltransferase involved in cellulose biosynthesis
MLERFSENSLIAGVLRKLASFSSLLRKSSIVCPQSDLSRGFAAYLERQSPNSRAHSRRLLSAFERDKVSYRIAENDEELGSFFDELVLLHQSRWKEQGEQGAFVSERVRSFHRAILRGLVPGGEVVLARLSDQEGSLAIVYGFIINKKFEFYQSGMRNSSNGRIKSPGILAHLLTMQHLSERGIRVYDFLGGESNYKTRLATDSQRLISISLYRPSFSTALVLGRRALAKVLK